ncbi:MAG: hypothetical protein JOZ29_15115 [Deltaproteobacteria bacterium]|nr:hypothetical protein [Deltaproteobacteria bacterium]
MPTSERRILSSLPDNSLTVATVEQLLEAIQNPNLGLIRIEGFLSDVPSFRLSPHQEIRGLSMEASGLTFREGNDGIALSSDNAVSSLTLVTSPDRCAIWNDDSVIDLGSLYLSKIRTVGRVRILARNKVRAGHVDVRDLDIVAADSRAAEDRPHDFGVSVLQGALTLWNMQPESDVRMTADVAGVSVGRPDSPVLGSGIFVAGYEKKGGSLRMQRLETRDVYSDGRIKPGTPDQISGGVFVLHGATVDLVSTKGPINTFGANDMALDNWGAVDRWSASEKVTTYGPSGIGFVNFGLTREITLEAPIETFGGGARGFNVYAGTVGKAEFDRIVTHGDGAVGIQISQPTGTIFVRRGIETFGGIGPSLVKGVIQQLPATALSIKPGARVDMIHISGGLKTHSPEILPLEQLGSVANLVVEGGCGQSELDR